MLGTLRADGQTSAAVFALNLSRDAHLGLVGGPATGKTSALFSVAAAVALLDADPAEVPVVCYLDVRGGLDGLHQLPNAIGASRNDIDGFRAVTAELEQQLDERASEEHSEADEPRRSMLVLIDEVEAYVELLDSLEPGQAENLLRRLIEDGPARGMHVVLTTTDRASLRDDVYSSVRRWLTLGSDPSTSPAGPPGTSEPDPGMARIGKNEIRFAPIVQPNPAAGESGDTDEPVDSGPAEAIDTALAELARALSDRGVVGLADYGTTG
jgi:hypothetical protein